MISVAKALEDRMRFTHPTLGPMVVYCTYEKLARVCRFCGEIGHEMSHCRDHQRLSIIMQSKAPNQPNVAHDILSPKKESWINNYSLLPDRVAPAQLYSMGTKSPLYVLALNKAEGTYTPPKAIYTEKWRV